MHNAAVGGMHVIFGAVSILRTATPRGGDREGKKLAHLPDLTAQSAITHDAKVLIVHLALQVTRQRSTVHEIHGLV